MNKSFLFKIIATMAVAFVYYSCGSTKETPKEDQVVNEADKGFYLIETKFGNMKLKLYDETPLHKANFEKLVADSFYNDLLFHRVINNFMIQGGDPQSKNAKPGQQLGMGNMGYTIPAEFNSKFIHKKGALAAARQGDNVNPQKASSGCQFYIVHGNKVDSVLIKNLKQRKAATQKRALGPKVMNDPANAYLKDAFMRARNSGNRDSINYYGMMLEQKIDELYIDDSYNYSSEQLATYYSIGGTPFLDMEYTVFGEIVEGLDIIDSIANVKTNRANRPDEDIKMTIKKL